MKTLARHRGVHGIVCALAMLGCIAIPVDSRAAASDARIAERLDRETAAAIGELIEHARDRGLPTDPLVTRALEGASRQAPGPRIVSAVQGLLAAMEATREALGPQSSADELVAGAAALSAGVRPDTLTRLRQSRPGVSLVVPLVVLTDLVTRRVPAATASAAVLAATRARVRDRDLMRLRERIGRDIVAGTAPADATILRTRSLIRTFEAPVGPEGANAPGRKPGP